MKIFAVGFFIALAAGAVSQATPVDGNQILTKKQAKELLRSASTPQDHMELAAYYRSQSRSFTEEARTYAAMADEYYRNPASHPIPKFPTYGDHCLTLSRQYLKDANKAEALARVQEQMAAR